MVKELNGRELVGFIKERQAHQVKALRSRKIRPKLVIIRDSNNPVIEKYVSLKKAYGEDIELFNLPSNLPIKTVPFLR